LHKKALKAVIAYLGIVAPKRKSGGLLRENSCEMCLIVRPSNKLRELKENLKKFNSAFCSADCF